jgi:hypothetical protein
MPISTEEAARETIAAREHAEDLVLQLEDGVYGRQYLIDLD